MLFNNCVRWFFVAIGALLLGQFEASRAQISGAVYTGLFSEGLSNSFALELSSDGSQVVEIVSDALSCSLGDSHTFTINPGIPVTGGRFSARDVPVPADPDPFDPHAHSLDIDGVFFDADGNGTPEQALGGLSFVSGPNRCNYRWVATQAAPDSDGDGWGDVAEQRLGAGTNPFAGHRASTPEHAVVPTTCLSGPALCQDFSDNDRDQLIDANEVDGPDLGLEPDCASPMPEEGLCGPTIPPTEPPIVDPVMPLTPIPCTDSRCQVPVICNVPESQGTACTNRIDLFAFVPRGALRMGDDGLARAPSRIRFAFGIANVPPGEPTNVRLKLTKQGKKIVRMSKKRRLRGIIEIRNTPGTVSESTQIRIRLRRR